MNKFLAIFNRRFPTIVAVVPGEGFHIITPMRIRVIFPAILAITAAAAFFPAPDATAQGTSVRVLVSNGMKVASRRSAARQEAFAEASPLSDKRRHRL